nr:MAG TPA: hypothetical protein [Caudoviricetes sp.]
MAILISSSISLSRFSFKASKARIFISHSKFQSGIYIISFQFIWLLPIHKL